MSTPVEGLRLVVVRAAAALVVFGSAAVDAAVIVDPARPLEHRVNVQLIQSAEDDGDPAANVFGDASQRAEIESRVNQIWAQAGVHINFLPEVNRLNSTKAYKESTSLPAILFEANEAGALSNDPYTINLVMVRRVPGLAELSDNTVAGYAYIGGNGIAEFVGDNLLNGPGGWDSVAEVTAHEIGHNLGLIHTEQGGDNLMSPDRSSARLDPVQIATVLNSDFVRPLTVLPGDWNYDGGVDAADFTIWRDGLGTYYTEEDYGAWRQNYGSSAVDTTTFAARTPEPSAVWIVALAFLAILSRRSVTRVLAAGAL